MGWLGYSIPLGALLGFGAAILTAGRVMYPFTSIIALIFTFVGIFIGFSLYMKRTYGKWW